MADVYEQNLPSKANLTVNDYMRVVGSDNNSYKQLVSDVAKKIIENYTGSSLAGSSQSVKSALDTLNSNSGTKIITLENATAGANASYYYKKGNVVTFFLDLTPNSSGTVVTVCRFDAGFRPPEDIRFPLIPVVHDQSETNMGTAFAVVAVSGGIQVYMSSARRVFLTGSFGVA